MVQFCAPLANYCCSDSASSIVLYIEHQALFLNEFYVALFHDQGFNNALERAFNYYMNKAETWKELVQKDMSIDFSWDSSASQYEELYDKAVLRARTASRS